MIAFALFAGVAFAVGVITGLAGASLKGARVWLVATTVLVLALWSAIGVAEPGVFVLGAVLHGLSWLAGDVIGDALRRATRRVALSARGRAR